MRNLLIVATVWFAIAAPAEAARYRQPQRALLAGPCEGDYVLLSQLLGIETELARVACVDLPVCVVVDGAWPDSSILGRYAYRDEQGTLVHVDLPAVRDNSATCP